MFEGFLQLGGKAPKMATSTMATGQIMVDRSETRPDHARDWISRETKGLFPDLRLAQKLIRTSSAELAKQIDSDSTYKAAERFNDTLTPVEEGDYKWVWDYAKFQFERANQIYRELDDKANDIIKYLGGGTGLFTLAAIANTTPRNLWVIIAAIPSFALAVVSIALARGRSPPESDQGATRRRIRL